MSNASSDARAECAVLLAGGGATATLVVAVLPKESVGSRALREASEEEALQWGTESIQLLEGVEYRYCVKGIEGVVSCAPEDVFTPDDANGQTGRMRPGLLVGRVAITVRVDGRELLGAVEVRSRKVDYLRHYRAMLRDLATVMTEVVMRSFAQSGQRFASDTTRDPPTLYQRFALLRSLLDDGALDAALREITSRPHRQWVRRSESLTPGRSLPTGSQVARQIVRHGPRRQWTEAPTGVAVDTLPLNLECFRTEETLDTPENRFVAHALRRWLSLLDDLRGKLEKAEPRARAEVDALADRLSAHSRHASLAEAGALQRVPLESQVLQKREGYREVFRLSFAVEAAAVLAWVPEEGTWHAGVRNVAALYEYWVHLQLATIVARVCGVPLDPSALLCEDEAGLKVSLRRGEAAVVRATVLRHGRPIEVSFHYNRGFPGDTSARQIDGASWTCGMRPDCSLRIAPHAPTAEPMWLHFDAKYRIDAVEDVFGLEVAPAVTGRAQREDLSKMHAYRDAIRQSAGAFVIFPGTVDKVFRRHYEFLPGIGAFPLAPNDLEGPARGEAALEHFISEAIDHAARRATQHERWRYWTSKIFTEPPKSTGIVPLIDGGCPPADVGLLVGSVKSPAHLAWIRQRCRYNLRADGRLGSVAISPALLSARYLLLRGSDDTMTLWLLVGSMEAVTGQSLMASGYPDPGGLLYLLLHLDREVSLPTTLSAKSLNDALNREVGSPSIPQLRTMAWLFEVASRVS